MAQVEFSLEEYLKDPLRKVVTRDGREVRIRCTDMDGVDNMVIVGLVRVVRIDVRPGLTDHLVDRIDLWLLRGHIH